MATTNGPVTLEKYVDKYTSELDKKVMAGTKTADLNMNQDLLGKMSNTGSIEVATIEMDGLAKHTRNSGYVPGNVTLNWETIKLEYERSREFYVDATDDEETDAVLSANLMAEFVRTKVVPEVDAVRFGRLAKMAGTKVNAALTADTVVAAVRAAETKLEDMGVDLNDCVMYCSAAVRNLLRDDQAWRASFGQDPDTRIGRYDGMKLVVPTAATFKTAFKLLDGTDHTGSSGGSDETKGGFEPATGAKDINFLVVRPDAVGAITKHQELRYFAPRVNQKMNSHLWQYQLYHDLVGYKNKADLVYLHAKA